VENACASFFAVVKVGSFRAISSEFVPQSIKVICQRSDHGSMFAEFVMAKFFSRDRNLSIDFLGSNFALFQKAFLLKLGNFDSVSL
jgi:hypothetical protein